MSRAGPVIPQQLAMFQFGRLVIADHSYMVCGGTDV
jgi:hypothetical protein